MVRHAPIHRRSGHSDIAICCGRNVLGSSPSTYGGAPLESGHHFESQTIQRIQNVFGRTLNGPPRRLRSPSWPENVPPLFDVGRFGDVVAHPIPGGSVIDTFESSFQKGHLHGPRGFPFGRLSWWPRLVGDRYVISSAGVTPYEVSGKIRKDTGANPRTETRHL